MNNYLKLMSEIGCKGHQRNTRTGTVRSIFSPDKLRWDLRDGFPAVTTKKLAWNAVVGELLWFLAGKTDLSSLRVFSGIKEDGWTIWTNDFRRWAEEVGGDPEEGGKLYGYQWRNFGGQTDQISNLIKNIKENPNARDLMVTSFNPMEYENNEMALKPCHTFFQCFVGMDEDGLPKYLDLLWNQRSVDTMLGLPFNIASYALLLEILARLTGLIPRELSCSLGDAHLYENHIEQANTQLKREPYESPELYMPPFGTLETMLKRYTAEDFLLQNYKCHNAIKAPLSVGG